MAILKHITHKPDKDYWQRIQYMACQTTKNKRHFLKSEAGAPLLRDIFEMRCYGPQGNSLPPEQWEELCFLADYYYNHSFTDSTILMSHFIIRTKEKKVPTKDLFSLAESLINKFCRGHICLCTMHDHNHVHILLHRIRLVDIDPHETWMALNSKGVVADYEYKAGHMYNSSPARIKQMKKHLMELCISKGLHQVDLISRSKDRKTQGEYYADKRNKPSHNALIKRAISEGVNSAWTTAQFLEILDAHGVQHEWIDDYVVYFTDDSKHLVSGRALGEDYTVEHILKCLCDNKAKHEKLLSQQNTRDEKIICCQTNDNDDNLDSPANIYNGEGEKCSFLIALFVLAVSLLTKMLKRHSDNSKLKAEKHLLEKCMLLFEEHEIRTLEDLDSLSGDKSLPFEFRSQIIVAKNKAKEILDTTGYESTIEQLCQRPHKSKESTIERV